MTFVSRLLAVALLALVTANAMVMGAEVLPATARTQDRPAGCHEHRHGNPSPQPERFVCCLSGHHSAMVRPLLTVSPIRAVVAYAAEPIVPAKGPKAFSAARVSSGDPPGPTSLRI